MKVISFNIRYRDDDNGHSIKERAFRLKRILEKSNASLIGLQECTPEWLTCLEEDYGKDYEIFNVWRVGYESTPILVKKADFEVLDKGCFWLSDTPDIPSNGWDIIGMEAHGTDLETVFIRLVDRSDGITPEPKKRRK